jgi:hypothetical protein
MASSSLRHLTLAQIANGVDVSAGSSSNRSSLIAAGPVRPALEPSPPVAMRLMPSRSSLVCVATLLIILSPYYPGIHVSTVCSTAAITRGYQPNLAVWLRIFGRSVFIHLREHFLLKRCQFLCNHREGFSPRVERKMSREMVRDRETHPPD